MRMRHTSRQPCRLGFCGHPGLTCQKGLLVGGTAPNVELLAGDHLAIVQLQGHRGTKRKNMGELPGTATQQDSQQRSLAPAVLSPP